MYDVLVGTSRSRTVVTPDGAPGLRCAPSTIDLAGAEIELVSLVARETRLQKAIEAYDAQLDYVIIDCPPSLGLLTVNALVAAEEVLIPIQCEYYALEGLGQLLRNIELVQQAPQPEPARARDPADDVRRAHELAEQVAAEVRSAFRRPGARDRRPAQRADRRGARLRPDRARPTTRHREARCYVDAARELAERGAPATASTGQGSLAEGRATEATRRAGPRARRADPDVGAGAAGRRVVDFA